MKTSKIKSLTFRREFDGKFGKLYSHDITLESGDAGEILAKSREPEKLKPGSELTYTTEQRQHNGQTYVTIKAVSQEQSGGYAGGRGKSATGSPASFALSYAKDVGVANVEAGNGTSAQEILKDAEVFFAWLKSKEVQS